MKKRLFSFFLCLCTIVALIPTSAFATSLISIIRPTVTAPVVGQKPSYSATLPSTASTEVKNVTWSGELDSSGCFKAGVSYTVRITVAVQDGQDKIISTTASKNILVNGKQAKLESVSSNQKQAVVAYTFPTLGSSSSTTSAVTQVAVTFPDLTVGSTPPGASQTSVSSSDVYVKDVEWISDYDGTVFQDNKDYTVYVTLGIKIGVNKTFNLIKATINGDSATIEGISSDKKEVVIATKYTSKTAPSTSSNPPTGFRLSKISFTVPKPVAGAKPASSTQITMSNGSNVSITKVEWESDKESNVFLNGYSYTIKITVKVKDGYTCYLDPETFNINGYPVKVESTSSDKKQAVVSYTFPATDANSGYVNSVYATVTAPAVGTTPATTAATSANSSTQVTKVEWFSDHDADTFQAGKQYTVQLTIGMKVGQNKTFNILDVSDLEINGKKATLESISSDKKQIVLSYTFPTLPAAASTIKEVAVTVPNPVVGGSPASTSEVKLSNTTDTYIKDVEWISDHEGDTFLAGKTYTVYVTLGIKSSVNKTFDLSKVTINGNTAAVTSISSNKKEVVIAGAFAPSAPVTTVKEVAITVPTPVVGGSPASTSEVKLSNTTDTYIKDVEWVSDHDGDTFLAGKTYTVYITVGIKSGVDKTFDLSKVTINGSTAAVTSTSSDKKEVVIAGAFAPAAQSFKDVKQNDWFYPYVSKICSVGKMTGKGDGAFDPNGNLSLAEVMVLASNLYKENTGKDIPEASGAWYAKYYSYCQKQGILDGLNIGEKDVSRAATRFEMVVMLDRAASKDKTSGGINSIKDGFIPDLKESATHGEVIYRWYRSGILAGDANHNFNGATNIKRSEVSVILCQLYELIDRAKF